jgi:hypothetical protein
VWVSLWLFDAFRNLSILSKSEGSPQQDYCWFKAWITWESSYLHLSLLPPLTLLNIDCVMFWLSIRQFIQDMHLSLSLFINQIKRLPSISMHEAFILNTRSVHWRSRHNFQKWSHLTHCLEWNEWNFQCQMRSLAKCEVWNASMFV